MRSVFFHARAGICGAFLSLTLATALAIPVQAEPRHGIAMYGDPALPQDFVSLPYANPNAPKGGAFVTGNTGGFDSLNPFVRKGTAPWQLRFLAYESLMGRNWDEPFALYGLLAESVEVGKQREWVEFTLREEARFSDGSPVTVEDVIWSYETLGTKGQARYRGLYTQIEKIEQTAPRKVRMTFNVANRELALVAGLRPILQKAQWEGKDFTRSGFDVTPIGTAPYVIDSYEPNRFLSLKRNENYWGKDLPLMQGVANFDEIRIEFFGDEAVLLEAFKAGVLNVKREYNANKWKTAYDFPAKQRGEVVLSEFKDAKPSGITGFVMNTRKPMFADWRVREALTLAFNFEYMNEVVTGGAQSRITSYFSGTSLGMGHGAATGGVAELLAPFKDSLIPGVMEGYALPASDGTKRNRKNLRRAIKLLDDAGWNAADGTLRNADGEAFTFTILLPLGAGEMKAFASIYVQSLARLGIEAIVETADNAQFVARQGSFDFDMSTIRRGFSLSPGNEQAKYWGRAGVDTLGSHNLPGVNVPAVEALVEAMVNAKDTEGLTAAVRALDRILTAGRYVIPTYAFGKTRIAHSRELKHPENVPVNGAGYWYAPPVWWFESAE